MVKSHPSPHQSERLPAYFTRAMQFVWLLRSDVRESLLIATKDKDEAFQMFCAWWVVFGRKEFPHHETPSEVSAIAQEPVGQISKRPMTRLMQLLYGTVQGQLSDKEAFLPWYYVFGVTTYALFSLVSEEEKNLLRQKAKGIQQDASLPITNLMRWVWDFRPDVQSAFPLATLEGREAFVSWFIVYGLKEHQLFSYLRVQDVIAWMKPAPGFNAAGSPPLSILMQLVGTTEFKGSATVNTETPEGRKELAKATRLLMAPGGKLEPIRALLHSLGPNHPNSHTLLNSNTREERIQKLQEKICASPIGVNLVGYALGELGIGEDVRMLAAALKTADVPFTILNRQPGPEIREMDFSVAEYLSTEMPYPITIIAMTGFDTALLWLDRPDLFETTYVIGFWPWELPAWPTEWDCVFELVDEVWASTRYTKNAYLKRSPVPVHCVPMAVALPKSSNLSRKDFDLPEGAFLFLFTFDFMSYPARKNPEGVIQAFLEAFPDGNENVGLVLKVSNRNESDPRWQDILKRIKGDSRITLIDRNLDRGDLVALTKISDAYISLHRAEGFGRTLAEALLLEKCVIATDYSGNTDYLDETTGYPVSFKSTSIMTGDYPFSTGQRWAEPFLEDAAQKMRSVIEDPKAARHRARAGQARIQSQHGAHIVGENLRKHLERLRSNPSLTRKVTPASTHSKNVQRKVTA